MRPRTGGVAVACLLGTIVFLASTAQGQTEPLDQARRHLEAGEFERAIGDLQTIVLGQDKARRSEALPLLANAYEQAIRQAESQGKTRAARHCKDDLAILRARFPMTAEPTPRSDDPAVETAALPPVDVDAQPSNPLPDQSDPAPADLPDEVVRVAANPNSQPRPLPPVEVTPTPATQPPANAPTLQHLRVESADAAFTAEDYPQAGKIYQRLLEERRLPDSRRDHLAYCRMDAIVRAINAQPRSAAEWDAVQREIAAVQALSPRSWFAEYLRSRVAELKAKDGPGLTKRTPAAPASPR